MLTLFEFFILQLSLIVNYTHTQDWEEGMRKRRQEEESKDAYELSEYVIESN